MDDLERYIKKRKDESPDFAKTFEQGYEQFRIGDLLRQARKRAGLTQEDLAEKLHTSQSRLAKMEAGDPSVSLDLLFRSLYSLGFSRKKLASLL